MTVADGGAGSGGGRLRDREVAFAGRLASMTRQEAAARVAAAGGRVVRQPGVNTAYLVVGHGGWPLRADGRPSSNMTRARRLKQQSAPLSIVSETAFLQLLGLTDKVEDLQRLFTTAQLSRILEVPAPEIRAWMRRKLIRPAKVVRRLAWFDFREVAMARALHALTSAGISAARIGRSIRELAQWLPDAQGAHAEAMLTQLETSAHSPILSVRLQDGRLADPAGQLLLDFHRETAGSSPGTGAIRSFTAPPAVAETQPAERERPQAADAAEPKLVRDLAAVLGMAEDGTPSEEPPAGGAEAEAGQVLDLSVATGAWAGAGPDELFQQGVRAEDAGQWQLARHLYEHALAAGEPDPETCFNLGNVLYELDRKRAAARRYLQAVALDAEYVESLNNLGNALAESGWLNEAVRAYRRALQLEPAYADAHGNLAETLVYLGRYAEARLHWTAYLAFDPHSSWANAIHELLRHLPADRN